MEPKTSNQTRTTAAISVRWGYITPEQRWQNKVDSVIQFVARLGWSTVEMVNYYLCQSKRDWVARMVREKWIISKFSIIDDRPATILVLAPKGHRAVKEFYPFLGRRIDKEASRQSGHDFIAAWVSVWMLRTRHDLRIAESKITIWSDRVMRGFIYDEETRPDISMMIDGVPILNIEVERTRKTNALEIYQFFKKIQYFQDNDIETLVIFEKTAQATKFMEEVSRARHFGLVPWEKNSILKRWIQMKNYDRKIFELNILVAIWDSDKKIISDVFYPNADIFED